MAELLIVDDDADAAEILSDVLARVGHSVRVARDGAEALEAIRERAPDCMLLDVEMPVLDGPGLAYRLVILDCMYDKIPIVLVSGVADLHRVAERVGTPYYIGKPCHLDDVLILLERALRERQPPAPRARTERSR